MLRCSQSPRTAQPSSTQQGVSKQQSWSQRGFCAPHKSSKHLQGCEGPGGSGAQPTSQMSTPRRSPPCCRGQNHCGERQRPAQDRNRVLSPHKAGFGSPHQAALRSPKSRHQISSAELEHFYILHLNQTGWKAVITSVAPAPFPVSHSISSLVLGTDPPQRGTV